MIDLGKGNMRTFMRVIFAGGLAIAAACSPAPVESTAAVAQEARVQIDCPGEAKLKSEIARGQSDMEEINTSSKLYSNRDEALQNNDCTTDNVSDTRREQHYTAARDRAMAACNEDFMNSFDCEEPCRKSLEDNRCAIIDGWPGLGIGNEVREVTTPDGTTYFQGYCLLYATAFAKGTAVATCSE